MAQEIFGAMIDINSTAPRAQSANAIALDQTLGGAGNFTLNGAAISGGSFDCAYSGGQLITFTSTGNISARTFTITGTDRNGAAQSETLSGPNNNTVFSTKYYKTVTQVASDGAVGTNTSIGIAAPLILPSLDKRGCVAVVSSSYGSFKSAQGPLFAFCIPTALMQVARHINVRTSGLFAANGNTKRVLHYLGATALTSEGAAASNNKTWFFDVDIYRTGSNAQRTWTQFYVQSGSWDKAYQLTAESDAADIIYKIDGLAATADSDVIIQTGHMAIDWSP